MTCAECTDLLGEAIELRLTAAEQALVETHCSGCDACRALRTDLAAIRTAAASLDRHEPDAKLWHAIAAKTGTRRTASWIPWAAAAALVLSTGAAGWLYVGGRGGQRAPSTQADATQLAQSAESELQQAEQHYAKAIAALEQLTAGKQDALDPRVREAIAQSLHTIDQAIADSRAALRAQPGSDVAQASLLEALRMKVSVLQETVSLINSRHEV